MRLGMSDFRCSQSKEERAMWQNNQPAYEGQTGHRSWTRKSSTHLPLDLSYTAVLRLYCMEAGFTEPRPEITYINESNLLLMAWLEQVPFFSSLQNRNHMDSILCISDSRFGSIFRERGNAVVKKHIRCEQDDFDLLFVPTTSNYSERARFKRGKKRVYRLRDSLTLLTASLATLGKTLCPQLGEKGSIAHDEVRVSTLKTHSAQLLDYMKQDIRLLGGVMVKAQEIFWTQYKVDIENCLTLSSLSMLIFRMNYYDPNSFPIHIPSRNEDTFIRRGYYGGHADVYKPYGENLVYYDVNSLYPYIMTTFDMPGGVPVWHGNLEGKELSDLYGFIEAYVVCPRTINRPFLPYRDRNNILLFPTGKFVGVYFSEEFIYARNLGYKIYPLRGYLFEKKPSPFVSFVSSLFAKRQKAKADHNDAMSYVYKILMNSLYGRFGINPVSTITEVCDRERYDYLILSDNLIMGDKLSEHYYIVSYYSNTGAVDWKPPKISAVQLAAAITACSRIHMYKYISRPDCYYTDTDSAILEVELPSEEVSSTELGKLKRENYINKGFFLAAKNYLLDTKEDDVIIKHKGLAKDKVDYEWFVSQYADLSRTKRITVESKFRIDWQTLNIGKKDLQVSLGTKVGTKRDPVYVNSVWVDTQPKDVIDLCGQEITALKFDLKCVQHEYALLKDEHAELIKRYTKNDQESAKRIAESDQLLASLQSEMDKLREEIQLMSAAKEPVMRPLTESPTVLEVPQPTLSKPPPKKKKPKKPKAKKKKPNDTS
ncbi:DNA-directed DNA polymerase [Abeliophyllum distichum]|uniref:DNA-directed DNA polymerase n=1 Tax=Abeliophyllum distichum TaxID=126358 RepID=A0ABD1SZ94_9LAMI